MSLICRKGCDKTFNWRANRSKHEKTCGVEPEPKPPAIFDIQEPIAKVPFDPEKARMAAVDALYGPATPQGKSG